MKGEYYWFKISGEVEKVSETAFYFLLERKRHTLVRSAGKLVLINQGPDTVMIKKKQLEQILVKEKK